MSPRQTMSLGDTLLQLIFRFIVNTVCGAYLPRSYVGSDIIIIIIIIKVTKIIINQNITVKWFYFLFGKSQMQNSSWMSDVLAEAFRVLLSNRTFTFLSAHCPVIIYLTILRCTYSQLPQHFDLYLSRYVPIYKCWYLSTKLHNVTIRSPS